MKVWMGNKMREEGEKGRGECLLRLRVTAGTAPMERPSASKLSDSMFALRSSPESVLLRPGNRQVRVNGKKKRNRKENECQDGEKSEP